MAGEFLTKLIGGKWRRVPYTEPTVSESVIAAAVQAYLIANPPTGYTHPSTHPATIITEDSTHRFASDTEKSTWNGKQNALGFTPVADNDSRLSNARTPTTHTHPVTDVTNAIAEGDARLTDSRNPLTHGHLASDITGTAIVEGDARLTDARTPLAHSQAQSTITNLVSDLSNKAAKSLYARVTGSDATTTGQSLVDITGLTLSLEANSVYEIYACLMVGVTAVTTGQQFGVNLSSTTGATISAGAFGTLAAATAQGKRISAFNTATTAFNTASSGTGIVIISGIVTTGATPPTLAIRHLKVTSGTSTVYIGSFVSAVKL